MSDTKQQIKEILTSLDSYYHENLTDDEVLILYPELRKAVDAIDRLVTKAYKKGFNAGSVKETLRHGEALKGVMEKFEQARGESQLNDKEK